MSHSNKIIHALVLTLFIYGLTPLVLDAYPSITGVDLVIIETYFTDSTSSINSSNPIDTVEIDSVIDNIESPKKNRVLF